MPKNGGPVNWDALRITVETSTGTALQKRYMWPKVEKAVKKAGIEVLTPQWRYSYVCARLSLRDYSDYWGWEFRGIGSEETSEWASELYWKETWLPKWGGGLVGRLLVLGEQGIGDAVFFASMLPDAMLRAKEVVYECDERLHSVLEKSLPGLVCRKERAFEDRREDYGPIDAFIPAAELMRMFRCSRTNAARPLFPAKPYLKADNRFEQYRGRVGIGWSGRQGKFNPEEFGVKDAVNLQWNGTWDGAENPPVDLRSDIDGVVSLCSVLDRVVCVPSSIQHFAGAVGCRVDIVVPPKGTGETENQIHWDYPVGRLPWYPCATVFENMAALRNGWHA